MSNAILIQAALELVHALIGAAITFGQAAGVPEEQLDAALREELRKFDENDPSQLKIPE